MRIALAGRTVTDRPLLVLWFLLGSTAPAGAAVISVGAFPDTGPWM